MGMRYDAMAVALGVVLYLLLKPQVQKFGLAI